MVAQDDLDPADRLHGDRGAIGNRHVAREFDPTSNTGSPSAFVEHHAEYKLERIAPDFMESDAYGHDSGNVLGAIGNPSFALGFALAYRLFAEKGGAR